MSAPKNISRYATDLIAAEQCLSSATRIDVPGLNEGCRRGKVRGAIVCGTSVAVHAAGAHRGCGYGGADGEDAGKDECEERVRA